MNLIQIKQIDGLQDALNAIASDVYDLDLEVQENFSDFDNYWGQFYWDENRVELKSSGGLANGREDISLDISSGGLRVYSDSYFESDVYIEGNVDCSSSVSGGSLYSRGDAQVQGSLSVEGNINATSSIGQIKYLNEDGDEVSLTNVLKSNYSGVVNPSTVLSLDNHIVGVRVNTIGEEALLTLPAPSASKEIIIKDEHFNSSTYNISISRNSSELVEGKESFAITGDGGFATVYSNGDNWFVANASGISI